MHYGKPVHETRLGQTYRVCHPLTQDKTALNKQMDHINKGDVLFYSIHNKIVKHVDVH